MMRAPVTFNRHVERAWLSGQIASPRDFARAVMLGDRTVDETLTWTAMKLVEADRRGELR